MHKKIFENPRTFLYCFTLNKEKMLTDRATIKSKKKRKSSIEMDLIREK